MGKIYNDVTEIVGGTPLVRLNQLDKDLPGNVAVKLEFYNPTNSVKDRIGKAIVDAAEASGQLKPGGTIVEGTAGNTGIGLATVYRALAGLAEHGLHRGGEHLGVGVGVVRGPARELLTVPQDGDGGGGGGVDREEQGHGRQSTEARRRPSAGRGRSRRPNAAPRPGPRPRRRSR